MYILNFFQKYMCMKVCSEKTLTPNYGETLSLAVVPFALVCPLLPFLIGTDRAKRLGETDAAYISKQAYFGLSDMRVLRA